MAEVSCEPVRRPGSYTLKNNNRKIMNKKNFIWCSELRSIVNKNLVRCVGLPGVQNLNFLKKRRCSELKSIVNKNLVHMVD